MVNPVTEDMAWVRRVKEEKVLERPQGGKTKMCEPPICHQSREHLS